MAKIITIDRGTGKSTGELPMFMRPNGDELIARRKKELETYLMCCGAGGDSFFRKNTAICASSNNAADERWFRDIYTQFELAQFMLNKSNHKVDGEKWSCGFLGSRWADTTLNGRKVRLAFYSRTGDPQNFTNRTKNFIISFSF